MHCERSRPRSTPSAIVRLAVAVVLTAAWASSASALSPDAPQSDTLSFGRFGEVRLYGSAQEASDVVLFVSGDGGWNLGVVDMARALASLNALVVGIDITHYLSQAAKSRESCTYAAADFEVLSQYVQKTLERSTYSPPVLVGYSSGATLVYAVLAQSPPGTFRGGISLGFCPDLPVTRPLCKGQGLASQPAAGGTGTRLLPADLATPWIALQGAIDQVCAPDVTRSFAARVGNGSVVLLPGVGHGFSVQKNWMPQFREAFGKLTAASRAASTVPPGADVAGLPLVELPAHGTPTGLLAVIVSGDGGWTSLDREVGEYLAAEGVPVVGLNSLRYFWTRRTPDEAGRALATILRHYSAAWKRERFALVGYSLGACVLPFMVSRLPDDLATRVQGVFLLGPSPRVDFEFHVTEWLGGGDPKTALDVGPEVAKLRGFKVLCFHGQEETDSLCPRLASPPVIDVALPGGHHFGGDYTAIARRLLAETNNP